MPNFTSGPNGQEELRFGCLSEYPTVRFTGHSAELEQISGESEDCHSSPFLRRRSKATLNCVPPSVSFFQIAALMLPSRTW